MARREHLAVSAVLADLRVYAIERDYDTIVAIGLLMFFRPSRARELLERIRAQVRRGGCAIVNVLVEGTTYYEMFEPGEYYLFGGEELRERFADWEILAWRRETFPAPQDTVKAFSTMVAAKPDPRRASRRQGPESGQAEQPHRGRRRSRCRKLAPARRTSQARCSSDELSS